MRIRLLASPPLFVPAGDSEYSVEYDCRDGVGVIMATLRNDTTNTIDLGRVDHGGDDVRLAWREGFDVAASEDAHRLADALVKSGLADELHPKAEPHSKTHRDDRGTPV